MRIKQLLSLLAALLIALAVAGCGDDDKTAKKAGSTGPTATPSVSEPDATGATGGDGSADKSGSADKDKDSGKRDNDSGGAPDDSNASGDGKTDSADNTARPPTSLQFLINDHKFVGNKLGEGPYNGKFGREVPPNSPVIVRIGVFDRATVLLRVKGPDSKTRVYNARKLPRLPGLSLGQAYELKIVGINSKAYIYATRQSHLVGPAG